MLSDTENKLLSRREVQCVFRTSNGLLTRQGAAEAIANRLGIEKGNVQIISLKGKSGVRDLWGMAYIFTRPEIARKQVPKHLLIRMLNKDERMKIKDELKKSKTTASVAKKGEQKPEPAKAS